MGLHSLLDLWHQLRPRLWSTAAFACPSLSHHSEATLDNTVLRDLRTNFAMEVAFIAEFGRDVRHFRHVDADREFRPLQVGDSVAMNEGYCQKIVDGRLPALMADTTQVPAAMAIKETRSLPIGSNISVPIKLSPDRLFGTICCFSRRSNGALGNRDLTTLRDLANLLGHWLRWEEHVTRSRDPFAILLPDFAGQGAGSMPRARASSAGSPWDGVRASRIR